MKTIHKQILDVHVISYQLPKNSKIICAREQKEEICIWYECDTNEKKKETVRIYIVGTGHCLPAGIENEFTYLGTAFLSGGSLVFHVYGDV